MALKVLHISGLNGNDEVAPLLVTVAENARRETFVVNVPRGREFVAPALVAARLERSGLTIADLHEHARA